MNGGEKEKKEEMQEEKKKKSTASLEKKMGEWEKQKERCIGRKARLELPSWNARRKKRAKPPKIKWAARLMKTNPPLEKMGGWSLIDFFSSLGRKF